MGKSVILGTAGHIDHGKSALVKALTGTDPDRLKEEKERGITIDIGFASLYYPSEDLTVGIVDVPGHERLIKNMLAGAGGIDVVLMVIAADEGIMPQSREHLAICELLKIKSGIIVITKIDLVDEEWIGLIKEDVREFVKGSFLEGADIVFVSAKTGSNLEKLKDKIREVSLKVEPKLIEGLFRLPIDRVFTQKGFGTIVTGTIVSGVITIDDPVEILPAGIISKVRGLQTHGRAVEKAYAGQRTGINLQGIDKEQLRRGDSIVAFERFSPTVAIDAKLNLLASAPKVKSRSLVHFYTGTSEIIARIIIYDRNEILPDESCYCQFRLQEPIVALSGDRYIIRRFSPLETIGGGQILDPHPTKRKKETSLEDLVIFEHGALREKIEAKIKKTGYQGSRIYEIEGWISSSIPEIRRAVKQLIANGFVLQNQDILFHKASFDSFKNDLKNLLERYHKQNPLKSGLLKEELRSILKTKGKMAQEILSLVTQIPEIVIDKDIVRLKDFNASISDSIGHIQTMILDILTREGFHPSFKNELAAKISYSEKDIGDILKILAQSGFLVRINDSMYLTKAWHDRMIGLLREFFFKKQQMTVAEFRDILNTTRKYALPLLEYLDSNKITLRVGDIRKFMLK